MARVQSHIDATSTGDTSDAVRALAADGVNGPALSVMLGLTEDQVSSLLEDTVKAWREFLGELACESIEDID